MLGGGRVRAECQDGNERICRIPGKLKKRVWMRRGDLVAVEPWTAQSDKRGDIKWRYTKNQARILKKKHNFNP